LAGFEVTTEDHFQRKTLRVAPTMTAQPTVLSNYYYTQGDFQKSRKAEVEGTTALSGR
jgi:hypothetical protein